jgi:hypothetical protein
MWPFGKEGSLLCHTCYDTRPWFHQKDDPKKGVLEENSLIITQYFSQVRNRVWEKRRELAKQFSKYVN